jgi:two-component system sensor kinase FixL
MKNQLYSPRSLRSALPQIATAALAAGIFIADIRTGVEVALAVLYVIVVLIAARFWRPQGVVFSAAGCIGLSVVTYFFSGETAVNAAIAVTAIGATTVLALERVSVAETLEQSEEQWREVSNIIRSCISSSARPGLCCR